MQLMIKNQAIINTQTQLRT